MWQMWRVTFVCHWMWHQTPKSETGSWEEIRVRPTLNVCVVSWNTNKTTSLLDFRPSPRLRNNGQWDTTTFHTILLEKFAQSTRLERHAAFHGFVSAAKFRPWIGLNAFVENFCAPVSVCGSRTRVAVVTANRHVLHLSFNIRIPSLCPAEASLIKRPSPMQHLPPVPWLQRHGRKILLLELCKDAQGRNAVILKDRHDTLEPTLE